MFKFIFWQLLDVMNNYCYIGQTRRINVCINKKKTLCFVRVTLYNYNYISILNKYIVVGIMKNIDYAHYHKYYILYTENNF